MQIYLPNQIKGKELKIVLSYGLYENLVSIFRLGLFQHKYFCLFFNISAFKKTRT